MQPVLYKYRFEVSIPGESHMRGRIMELNLWDAKMRVREAHACDTKDVSVWPITASAIPYDRRWVSI